MYILLWVISKTTVVLNCCAWKHFPPVSHSTVFNNVRIYAWGVLGDESPTEGPWIQKLENRLTEKNENKPTDPEEKAWCRGAQKGPP